IEGVFAGKIKPDEGKCRHYTDTCRDHGCQGTEEQRILKGVYDGLILRQLDKPAETEAFHREYPEMLGVKSQDNNHDYGSKHKDIDEDRIQFDECPAERKTSRNLTLRLFHELFPLKTFEDLVDPQITVIGP